MTSSSQAGNDENAMEFMQTESYQRPTVSAGRSFLPVPESWRQYNHPNGDIYYYNEQLRLTTPEDIRDPIMMQFVLDARADHLQCLQEDDAISKLADDWELTLSDVTDSAAVIGMFSRRLGVEYAWTEDKGLEIKEPQEYFWSHVAEYPSHHSELPPNAEDAFVQALINAKAAVATGVVFPFTAKQIDQIIDRYQYLKALQAQGKNVIPSLGWLMGAIMPLNAVEKACSDEELELMIGHMQF